MSKKSKRKRAEEKRKNAKNKVTVVDATSQPNQGEQVSATDTTSQPNQGEQVPGSWVIADKKKAQEAAAKVASAMQEEQEFFEYVKNYTNGFNELLESRDVTNASNGKKIRPRGTVEDMNYHIKLSELINKIGSSMRETEEQRLKRAYKSISFTETEKRIIYRRLNVLNPKEYPDLDEQQK